MELPDGLAAAMLPYRAQPLDKQRAGSGYSAARAFFFVGGSN